MNYHSININPSSKALKHIDKAATKLVPEDPQLLDWHNAYVSNHRTRLAQDLEIVKKYIGRDKSILEFGSVPLVLTAALAFDNYNVTGIDIHPERYKDTIEKVGIDVLKCDIEHEKLPVEDNAYDTIIFNELFEHLRINPIFTLSECLRVLRPGGMMMLSTPNLRSLMGIYNFLVKGKAYASSSSMYAEYKKLEKLGHMGHVREYTTTEVSEFLEKIGFKVTEVIYRGRYGTNFKQAMARIFPSCRPLVSYLAIK